MPVLHTALQDGFNNDEVVVRVGGRAVFQQPRVKTRTQIGLAATQDTEVPRGPVIVEIALPQRQLAKSVSLDIAQDTYLGVSVSAHGEIEHVVALEPFGYA